MAYNFSPHSHRGAAPGRRLRGLHEEVLSSARGIPGGAENEVGGVRDSGMRDGGWCSLPYKCGKITT